VVDVTSRDCDGKWFDRHRWVEAFVRLISTMSGGAFLHEGVGSYVNSVGEYMREDTTRIQAFCSVDELRAGLPGLLVLLLRYARETHQERVLLFIHGHVFFLTPNEIQTWLDGEARNG